MKHRDTFIIPVIVSVMAICLTVWMWYFKIQLGLHRYFDIDELAYLYWATHIHMGLKPYIDFLFYPAPGFFALLIPIVSLFQGVAVFAAARGEMLLVFISLSIVLSLLFWELRRSWIVIFVPLLLLVLSLPSDKFIEIRPDTFAMTLFLFGLWGQMRMMNARRFPKLVIGAFYGASIIVSQKMILSVGIAGLGLICWTIARRQSWKSVFRILGGMVIVGFGVFVYLVSLGNFPLVWYSLTTLPFEISSLGRLFPIPPLFFFYPNDVVYGTGGYHIGYWLNTLLWSSGLVMGTIRFFIALNIQGKRRMWQELIISTVFLSSLLIFYFFLPMKHAQYLIPPAVFIVFYVADGIWEAWRYLKRTVGGQIIFFIGCCSMFFFFWRGYTLVTMPKLWWRNDGDIQKAETVWKHIPHAEPVFDMVGLTMKYPQPYIAPTLPVGQIAPLISYTLPPLMDALISTNTKFIYSGPGGRIRALSDEDQLYITERFTAVYDKTLWVRNDIFSSQDWK